LKSQKRETTIQSESLIKGECGPLIWLHFGVSDTGCWESQETSHQDPQSPESRKHFVDKRLVTTMVICEERASLAQLHFRDHDMGSLVSSQDFEMRKSTYLCTLHHGESEKGKLQDF
jgi:hypothetical protein